MLSIASMEVTSDPGIMASREPFSVGPQKSPTESPPAMKLSYTTDGRAVYTPIPTSSPSPFQPIGGGGPGGNIDAGGGNGLLAPGSQQGMGINMGEPMKKKRGRPRKYGPAGSMALAVVPMKRSSTASAEAMKKARGRPPGSGKKRQMAALGSTGIGFIPHIIMVKAGEDVFSKIISFSQHGPRAVCVLSANGAISNVTLRQAATSGGTVTYEGRFEILSLSGSSLPSESDGQRSRTGGLSVSLAGSDGRVLGGGVAGPLTAASPVQVIVGSFLADGKKESKPKSPPDPMSAPAKLVPSGPIRPSSPPSRGTQSGSSGGPGSPLNQNTSTFNNNNQQGTSNMPWI